MGRELQTMNQQNKLTLWAERVSACRDSQHGAAAAEVMLRDFTGSDKVYIAWGYTDLRRGIDGLITIVQQA